MDDVLAPASASAGSKEGSEGREGLRKRFNGAAIAAVRPSSVFFSDDERRDGEGERRTKSD